MISRKEINELVSQSEPVNITFTLSTHRTGEEAQQDPIRFRNMITLAEKKLKERGLKPKEIEELLAPARQKLDYQDFWLHAEEGLAVYINSSASHFFKLPYELAEHVYVDDHFMVTPLLPMVSLDGTFNILALSLKNIRLFSCTRELVREITPGDIFTTIEDYVEEMPQAQLQFHTNTTGDEAVYFGHGSGGDENKKIVVQKYMRGVEESVTEKLRNIGGPLILAGTEDILSLYRGLNNYKHTVDSVIKGSPAEAKPSDLQKEGWTVIQEYFLEDMYRAIKGYEKENDERSSNNLTQIIESTLLGKTDTLFLALNESSWGRYDMENNTVHYSANNGDAEQELLNWTALKVMEFGGQVYVLQKRDMPSQSTAAALFRF